MAGEVEVANVALGMIGEAPITSFQDDLETARAVNLRFPTVRDAVLRSHFWNFATRRKQLAQLSQAPAFGFDAQFQLPADWLRMLTVNPGESGPHRLVSQVNYTIEGRRLLIRGDTTARIVYIARVADLSQWDTLATEALAGRLASELAVSITQNRELAAQLWSQYRDKLAEARSVDGMDIPPQALESNEWIRSRFGTFPFLETLPPFEDF
mgnify:CR=1 FL=1